MRNILKFRKPLKEQHQSNSEVSVIPTTENEIKHKQVIEEAYTIRKNDLINEFVDAPPRVYNSNLSCKEEDEFKLGPDEPEELLEDDVEFLKDRPDYAKPNIQIKTANYRQ